jgi:phosphoglycolate phosphatase
MRCRAVVFDLDGTLLDTLEDLADSMNQVLSAMGYPLHRTEDYRYFVGDGMEMLVRRALPAPGRKDHIVARGLAAMEAEYRRRWSRRTRPYPGVPAMLEELRSRRTPMAILSNKPQEFTRMTVSTLLQRWSFDAVSGARPGVPRKPDPTAALEIAAHLRVRPRECFYLGDTATDMETACRAGMYAVGALWGFRGAAELEAGGARVLARKPADFLEICENCGEPALLSEVTVRPGRRGMDTPHKKKGCTS